MGKGINLGKKNKSSAKEDFNYEEYEKEIEKRRKENDKDHAIFFLNELVGEYGYSAVLRSLDKSPNERDIGNPLDFTINILIIRLGKELLDEYIYYYRNLDVRKYINDTNSDSETD